MSKILVVANRTVGGGHLLQLLRERIAAGDLSVHVVVPAGPPAGGWTYADDDDDDMRAATLRLETALRSFSALGCEVTGEIGDSSPMQAVNDVLRREHFDEVIVSTLPPGPSRWLRADLVSRLSRALDIPVTHVVGSEEKAST